jgi:Holliday junction DNA helicase RuvA
MIASVRGVLVAKDAEQAVIECQGVGYGVHMPVGCLASLGALGSEVFVFVYTHVGQEVLRLYGFLNAVERDAFVILVGTSGIGPKLALAILSTLPLDALAQAVAESDVSVLTRIPGVGAKKAERLLIELRGKLSFVSMPLSSRDRTSTHTQGELKGALVHLGFSEQVAEEAAKVALSRLPGEQDVATLLREALRVTTRR